MERDGSGGGMRLWGSLAALAALALCFAVGLPWWRQRQAAPAAAYGTAAHESAQGAEDMGEEQPEDALERFRKERIRTREMELALLEAVAQDLEAGEEIRGEANRRILDLTEYMEQEVTLEGLLRAQGFAGVLCTVHSDAVNVLVRGKEVTQAQAALILDIAMRQTGQSGGSVRVIPVG